VYPIQLRDVIRLLIGDRPEQFPYERAISLFKFQVWILLPDQEFVHLAALTAATKILERIQDDVFVEQQDPIERSKSPWLIPLIDLNDRPPLTADRICDLRNRPAFHAIFNSYVANLGGLDALLHALPPPQLDATIRKRIENCSVVTDLVDYRLRYARTIGANGNASTDRHAKFFTWWPTRKMPGGRGVRPLGKSASPKTMDKWSDIWDRTQIFLYLNVKCDFQQFPGAVDNESFVDHLRKSANDIDGLRRFFGAYAFVSETLAEDGKRVTSLVPESLPRVAVEAPPFTEQELATIAAYDANNFYLEGYQKEDDD
jgi:hypothetical protein